MDLKRLAENRRKRHQTSLKSPPKKKKLKNKEPQNYNLKRIIKNNSGKL